MSAILPKVNKKRALFVVAQIKETLSWGAETEGECDNRLVETRKVVVGDAGGAVLDAGKTYLRLTSVWNGGSPGSRRRRGTLCRSMNICTVRKKGSKGDGLDDGIRTGESGEERSSGVDLAR